MRLLRTFSPLSPVDIDVSTPVLSFPQETIDWGIILLKNELRSRKEGKVYVDKPLLERSDKARNRREVIRRLSHIQQLARQENYGEIARLLQESYV